MVDSSVVESTAVAPEAATGVFAALSDPVRLQILGVLADAGRCVCEIRTAVPIAPNLLSYHLRVLRSAGLIEGARRGRWVDYRIADRAAARVAAALGTAGFTAAVEQPDACGAGCGGAVP